MEVQRDYPIETFDPLLRDLIGWGLVTHEKGPEGTKWQIVPRAQQRLDELIPTACDTLAVIYLDHRCADCRQRRPTRLYGESYLCDRCWEEEQTRLDPVAVEQPPMQQPHFWRRSRSRPTTTMAG